MTSCMIILLILASLLSVRAEPSATGMTGCDKISDKYDIISEATIDKLQLDNYSTEIGTKVTVSCLNKDFVLYGPRELTCLPTRQWNPDIKHGKPTCGVKQIQPKSYNLIIGLSVGGGCLLITIIIVAFVVRRRKRNKEPTRNLDQRLNKSKQKKIYSEEMKTKYMDQETSLDKQPSVYKVWSYDRAIKKFITAFNHSDLTQKGGKIFGVKDVLIVLEEDGTEIEDDSALEACKDKTLQIISKKQSWYRNSLPDNVVIDLRDVQDTGSDFGTVRSYRGKIFGVKDVLIVLEKDGTEIEDDSALEACKDKTLQIISKKQSWYRNSLPDNVVIDLRDGQDTGSDFGTVRSYRM